MIEATDLVPGRVLQVDGAEVGVEHSLGPGRAVAHFRRPTGANGSGFIASLKLKGLRPGTAGIAVESLTLTTPQGVEVPNLPPPSSAEFRP
jgi:hypothetical protein